MEGKVFFQAAASTPMFGDVHLAGRPLAQNCDI